ncbi:hypothetical protein [Streptosporangium vulgare]|uniref:Uncharacterized protein n=1 Tax=Streptosporangium vulgare TaxID=46190 RepID=A0ABV5TF72_9ACTN
MQDQLSTGGPLYGHDAEFALMFLPVAALLITVGLARDCGETPHGQGTPPPCPWRPL